MKPRYTNLSSIEPHPDYPLKMYYADEVDARIAELEKALREIVERVDTSREGFSLWNLAVDIRAIAKSANTC